MKVYGVSGLTLPASDVERARRWYQEALGLAPPEPDDDVMEVGDIAITFGPALAIRLVAAELPDRPVRLVDPDGTVVDVVEPDHAAARAAEQHIAGFIEGAAGLGGPTTDELADHVTAVVSEASERIGTLLAGVPHNKVLATQLLLSQRAREAGAASAIQWPLHAASTLMSSIVIAGAGS
jgi:catechol 2,3-dioxygenase-like lactoylglutathione lyase family enzyme